MFKPEVFYNEALEAVKKQIKGRAVIGVSGGVDSIVAAKIVSDAIGDDLLGVHVDNGFMRHVNYKGEKMGESDYVVNTVRDLGMNVSHVDASEEFLDACEGVSEPEKKRKIIGAKFIDFFEREAKKFGAEYLVQGTIAPDWIESGDKLRDNIKSHHNVGGLPEKMNLKLVEPNRNLYKDDVREVARSIGIPKSLCERQPFPGPGLAIRVIGPITRKNVSVAREANYIWESSVEEAIENGIMDKKERQYLAAYCPETRVVGVHGDKRAYAGCVFLRSIETSDYMSCAWEKVPYEIIDSATIKIGNELKENVGRVLYDTTNKPPGTVEFE